MNKIWMALIAAALGASALGQGQPLYTPVRSVKDQGITLKSWGNGTAAETDETSYEGNNSIRVALKNYFQGVRMEYEKPIDLGKEYSDKNNLLRITYRLVGSSTSSGPGAGGGGPVGSGGPDGGGGAGAIGPGAGPGGKGGGRQGGGGRPGGFGPGGPGAPGGFGPGGASSTAAPTLKNLRVTIHTSDGLWSEAYINLTTNSSAKDWREVAVPLQAITGFDRTNKVIDRIGISGDATSILYIGEIRMINDATPIRADATPRELNLALGDEITFTATGSGGASVLKYSWDFDDKDGIQEDAIGQVVKRKFRKAGTYTITLTVSDEFKLKTPYTLTIKCTVNP